MTSSSNLGPTIAARREFLGLKQRELGDAVGLSRQRITQIEAGRKGWLDAAVFNALAKALDEEIIELIQAGCDRPHRQKATAHDAVHLARIRLAAANGASEFVG